MSILIKPIITEKATNDSELKIASLFMLKKMQIRFKLKILLNLFIVSKSKKVRTLNVRSNSKIRYTKSGIQYGKTNSYKKAIVQLQDGETIDLYANSQ